MAGRYVIIEFESKELADRFLEDSVARRRFGFIPRAAYLKPKQFCNCSDKTKQTANNWRKHGKYGLYICSRCKLPSKHHQTGIVQRLQYVFGYNLLTPKE